MNVEKMTPFGKSQYEETKDFEYYHATGVYYNPSPHACYLIKLESLHEHNIKATVLEIDKSGSYYDHDLLKQGDEIVFNEYALSHILYIDIWAKYYFPVISPEENQYYHKDCEDDRDYILELSMVLKEAYRLGCKALKELQ